MRRIFSRLFNTLPKRLIAGAIVIAAVALPVSSLADTGVSISAQTGIANYTAGDTTYSSSVNADYDQVVKVQVVYDNLEAAGSGKTANNLRVKINIPSTPGASQTITTTTSADNSNTVTGSAQVNLDDSTAYLQYIPGSAVWKHAVSANSSQTTEQVVSDDVVYNSNGLVLENENPCQAGSVTVMARVMVPGVKIVKQSEVLGQNNAWSNDNTAQPGDTLKYMITYENIGNSAENNVAIGDNLPPNMTIVPNTTTIYNSTYPNGTPDTSNNITNGGIDIGSYNPGATAYVVFEAKIADASSLACGVNEFRNVGVAQPQGMDAYYNTAVTDVTNNCSSPTPAYTCNLLSLNDNSDARTVAVTNFQYTASNGATFKDAVIDWGDGSTPLTTNNLVGQSHQYASAGNYTVNAVAYFTVNGQTVSAGSQQCSATANFAAATTTGTGSGTTGSSQLVNTGPGDTLAIFGAVTAISALGYRFLLGRRLARK